VVLDLASEVPIQFPFGAEKIIKDGYRPLAVRKNRTQIE
jgi:hypothetical protein